MQYKLLGKSGLRVSELCLGTMTFGEDWGWGSSKEESQRIYQVFREAGGNFIDTANIYTNGTSEKFLGEFIASERNAVVLATKYTNGFGDNNPNGGGNQRKNMVQSVEASLKRLNTDYIDVLWLHAWDFMTPPEEVMRAFDDLVRAGKVLYIGISDAPAWVVSQCNTLAELRGWTQFIGLQIEYSLIQRTPEREILPMAKTLDIGVTAWSPLASGWLTGKYTKANTVEEERRLDNEMMKDFVNQSDRNLSIAKEVDKVAEEIGKSSSQVALNWLLNKGVIPIIGARKVSHIEDNIQCVDVKLSADQIQQLEKVSQIELGFPHDFFNADMPRNFVYNGTFDKIDNHRYSQLMDISRK
ncbi:MULTISPECIES: aldo/keto reductase [Okeania]|uniref:Aldo/keto reductase n=1 Tax=Okeania hirsuta TaxID=1458930 RepID=A0A3N6NZZ7_9CYAN|nr:MULTISPECIES: aldo/keto reductase [Okeania]NES77195.1 aldo/keto reductase [Okeania sp. SIO1H4]NES89253.1 aldo/keto reductase [Okeania sp. SIO2B9]NET20717.1 aldo/keto reductase [Okeania sp. SIO1H5]NET76962.1 aldo/keto reductase [Okeania sp. SIO1F9]NET94330.1 aldo/keto reductase [Okeania sp. SIO1H2]